MAPLLNDFIVLKHLFIGGNAVIIYSDKTTAGIHRMLGSITIIKHVTVVNPRTRSDWSIKLCEMSGGDYGNLCEHLNIKKQINSDTDANSLPCLNDLNRPNMPALVATREQKLLYRDFQSFEITVEECRMHVLGDKNALDGKYKGPCPVMLRYIGGGQITNKPLFDAWLRPHESFLHRPGMFIFTMYPRLAPEDNFRAMAEGCDQFAACFEAQIFPNVETEIKKLFGDMTATLQDQFLAISDSAGGLWLAITLMSHPAVDIRSAQFWYPMAGLYRRKLGPYRGFDVSAKDATESGLNWLDDGSKIRLRHLRGRGRTPPLGMGGLAVNATWTYCKIGDLLEKITLLEVLTQCSSILELASIIDPSYPYPDVGKDMLFHADLLVEPKRIFERLGNRLSNLGLQYLPSVDALEFIEEKHIPQLYKPREPLRVAFVQGTSDNNTPLANTVVMAKFFQRCGAEVRLEKVQDASHAFDVPIVQQETGKKDNHDWKETHRWSTEVMEWTILT